MSTRSTIYRQCPDQPLRSGMTGPQMGRNLGAAGGGGRPIMTAGPCVSILRFGRVRERARSAGHTSMV